MKRTILFTTFIFLVTFFYVKAQDVHYTDYQYAGLYFNPAQTGGFSGTYRIGGIYRSQFSNFIINPFQSTMFSVDAPLNFGFKDHHWIGLGGAFYFDQAGDIALRNAGGLLSLSYHISLDKDYKRVITLGGQLGQVQRSVNDADAARFPEDLLGGTGDKDRSLIEDYKQGYTDINFGVMYKQRMAQSLLEFGVALYHINNPSPRFNNGMVDNPVGRRLNIHGIYRTAITERFQISPIVYFSSNGTFTNTAIQCKGYFTLLESTKADDRRRSRSRKKEEIGQVYFGLGYRLGDAIQMMAGTEFRDWHIGISYDMTVSSAANYNNSFGAIELAAYKIIKVYKKPVVDPTLFCPRF